MTRLENDGIGIVGIKDSLGVPVDPATGTDIEKLYGLVDKVYDYVGVAYPTTSSEVYTFKVGGSGGTTVVTITLVYTDATKANLSSATKS